MRAGESRAPRRIGAQIKGEAGPPEGVPATRFLLLLDRAGGTSLVISLFESDEDMRTGDPAQVVDQLTAPLEGGSPGIALCRAQPVKSSSRADVGSALS